MSTWYSKNLGDAMLAGQALEDIRKIFDAEYQKPGSSDQMAVFIRHESEGHLHCEVKVYFTPAALIVARAVNASPCVRPSPEGLDLLRGVEQAWRYFHNNDGNITMITPGLSRVIAGLDGDEELLAGIAGPVAGHYSAYAEQMRLLRDDKNYIGLQKIAHKLKATWSIYASDNLDAPERLEAAIRANDEGMVTAITGLLIKDLHTVAGELNTWLESYTRHNN